MKISDDEHNLLTENEYETNALNSMKGILKGSGNSFTIDDTLLNKLDYDCLADSEKLMFAYLRKEMPKVEKPVFSYIFETNDVVIGDYYEEGEKGYVKGDEYAKNRDNIRSILGKNIPINDKVEPLIGNSFFICRMYKAKDGKFPYHAAFVIYADNNYFFTLETWTEYVIKDDKEVPEYHWGFDIYGKENSDIKTYHVKRKNDYMYPNMKEERYPITIQIAIRKKYRGE